MKRPAGFTLVELVMAIVIIGILGVAVAPRFFEANVFKARGFADEAQAALRYAQKAAIAQHRLVCVAVTASPAKVELTVAKSGTDTSCDTPPSPTPLNLPASDKNSVTSADAILSAANFAFNALGSPFNLPYSPGDSSVAQAITVNMTDYTITIERETGYVHR